MFSNIMLNLPKMPLTILTRCLSSLKGVKNDYMSGFSQIPFYVSGSPRHVCFPLSQLACVFGKQDILLL